MQRLRSVNHPLRKYRRSLRGLAQRDRPVVEPAGTFFSYIGVGQAISLVAKSVGQRDEVIASLAHDIEQLADVVGLELVAVKQQDLFWLITDCLFCKTLGILKPGHYKKGSCQRELILQRGVSTFLGVFVDPGVHPVPCVKRDGGDAIAAGRQKRFGLTPRLKIATSVQKGVSEVSELHVMFGEQQLCDALALHHIIFHACNPTWFRDEWL